MFSAILLSAVAGGALAPAASAQDSVRIQFESGATDTQINGTIVGDEYIDYVVNARAGQTMVVALDVTATNGNGSAFFNILPAGKDFDGLYTGHMDDDNRAEVTVPSDGDWAIRVYLMGNDRDAGKTVGYAINLYITPTGASSGSSTPASGSSPDMLPEEDFFIVNLSTAGGTLNVRDAPRASGGLVGKVTNGTVMRNTGGCTLSDGQQWCKVEPSAGGPSGWVAARFLSLPQPGGQGQATQLPSASRMERVTFSAGTTGTELGDQLGPNTSVTYLLGAKAGQNLYFRLAADASVLSWRIYNPDGSLADQGGPGKEYRGELWQTGEHKFEVMNSGGSAQSFNVIFSID
ncbi:SH3 domain-containing protein [Roseovarius aestuariivivens]|uniref:SH3 domain-containing protein n=1 Tax=Roseovarius aestuariivivens TaxID=1888910 RepID=UPI00143690C8|nr:SH3 domain-containing protein [Roseovarius aestuariivivens]